MLHTNLRRAPKMDTHILRLEISEIFGEFKFIFSVASVRPMVMCYPAMRVTEVIIIIIIIQLRQPPSPSSQPGEPLHTPGPPSLWSRPRER